MISVLLNGYDGRMGTVLREYIQTTSDVVCRYGISRDTKLQFSNILEKPDVIIDFSAPEATFKALDYATQNLVPIVIATTGFSDEEINKIKEFSQAIPIFMSSNMSYNLYLMSRIAATVAPYLSDNDIEIVEKHHNRKCDSPSGTALLLANCINEACKNKYTYTFDRNNKRQVREKNEIGFSSVRGGNIVGEHEVLFIGNNEIIEIRHCAQSRTIFAEGAVRAARFVITKKKGLFNMEDLLN